MKTIMVPQISLLGVSLFCLFSLPVIAQEGLFAPTKPQLILKAPDPENLADAKRLFVANYSNIAESTYQSALSQSKALYKAVTVLVKKPSAETHLIAKLSWMQARLPYLQGEAFRFYGKRPEGETGSPASLNRWPINPAHIDYTDKWPGGGIIGRPDTYPSITPELLERIHRDGDKINVATGYHVIEFLLWGEDHEGNSSGKRSYKDYDRSEIKNADRRGDYLVSCCELLVKDLERLASQWKSGEKNSLRSRFLALPVDEAIKHILEGVSALTGKDLASDQIDSVFSAGPKFNEQSTFSDTTHFDFLHTMAGASNLAAGAYVGLDGKLQVLGLGLIGLAEEVSPSRARSIRSAANGAMKAAQAFKGPFDQFAADDKASLLPDVVMQLKSLSKAIRVFSTEIDAFAADLDLK